VASCCECGNEPWGSGATELGVSSHQRLVFLRDTYVEDGQSSLLLCISIMKTLSILDHSALYCNDANEIIL
jgi:hypothetical protein